MPSQSNPIKSALFLNCIDGKNTPRYTIKKCEEFSLLFDLIFLEFSEEENLLFDLKSIWEKTISMENVIGKAVIKNNWNLMNIGIRGAFEWVRNKVLEEK